MNDGWGQVISEIELAAHIIPEAFEIIDGFSHLVILFYMNQVSDVKAIAQYRHLRNNTSLPKLGTFPQRNKSRPNKLGLTTVELLEHKGNTIRVSYLDAIDGAPIWDIKPVMYDFEPKGKIRQPAWVEKMMNNYW